MRLGRPECILMSKATVVKTHRETSNTLIFSYPKFFKFLFSTQNVENELDQLNGFYQYSETCIKRTPSGNAVVSA